MAEQSRRFGERLSELREAKGWKQKDVVSAMAEAGDLALNTNQLSRYENGGAYPNESRMQRFAQVFEVDFAELVAPRKEAPPTDLSEALSQAEPASTQKLEEMLRQVLDQQAQLLADVSQVRSDLELLSQQQERPGRGRAGTRKSSSS